MHNTFHNDSLGQDFIVKDIYMFAEELIENPNILNVSNIAKPSPTVEGTFYINDIKTEYDGKLYRIICVDERYLIPKQIKFNTIPYFLNINRRKTLEEFMMNGNDEPTKSSHPVYTIYYYVIHQLRKEIQKVEDLANKVENGEQKLKQYLNKEIYIMDKTKNALRSTRAR